MKKNGPDSRKNLSAKEKAMITRDLFERFRQGATTQEENEVIESLEKKFIPEKEMEITNKLIRELDNETKDFIFRQTGVRIENPKPPVKKRILSPVFIGSVAGIVLLVTGVFLFYKQHNSASGFPSPPIVQRHIAATAIENITLPDGSQVVLNTGSMLSLHEDAMDGKTREVWLDEGEAFFNVKSDDTKPFFIHLRGGLTVRVLGTIFTIQSYEELPFQEISVLTGKVKVETSDNKGVELTSNQKATYHVAENELSTETVNSVQKASWRTGTIILENATLDELRFRIGRQYDKRVIFEEQPETMSVNITLNKETSPDEVAAEIAALYGLSYRLTAEEIIFYSKVTE
jgi:Fe2+-dicitrate sensor, membrane component